MRIHRHHQAGERMAEQVEVDVERTLRDGIVGLRRGNDLSGIGRRSAEMPMQRGHAAAGDIALHAALQAAAAIQ